MSESTSARIRLDKWLWAARLFKTRSLASAEIGKGHVLVNGQAAMPAREVRLGDSISLRQGQMPLAFVVKGLSEVRGPAPVAQALYEQTPDSIATRAPSATFSNLWAGSEPGAGGIGIGPPARCACASSAHASVRSAVIDISACLARMSVSFAATSPRQRRESRRQSC